MWLSDYAVRITEDSDNQGTDNGRPTVMALATLVAYSTPLNANHDTNFNSNKIKISTVELFMSSTFVKSSNNKVF